MRFALTALLLPLAVFAQGTVTLQLVDYAAVPQSGELVNGPDNAVYVARVNFLREEPGGGLNRFFVCDLNGKLYILDQTTRQFTTYLDFHRNTAENPTASGLFPAFTRANGYANGLVTFQFDPEYRAAGSPHFGKFYTVHIEVDTNDGDPRRMPNASSFSGYSNAATYAPSTAFEAPGNDNANTRHAVLIEWQDTNPANATFEGTARELMRVEFNGRIHPMGDLSFSPRATSAADADWRNLYIAVGDGGAGEQNNAVLHATPQRLDVLQGKILRISPDDPDGAGPLRYGIPNDNPFTGPAVTVPAGTRPEIWAYGFRNPHRLSWDPLSNVLLASDIGFHTWEEVNVVRRGGNYGWADREGTFGFDVTRGVANAPSPNPAGSLQPVIQYPHSPALGFGDAVAGGFVYRGTRLAPLRGKFIFGDITTGELFYADLAEMISAADRNDGATVPFHSIKLEWDNPRTPIAVLERYDRMYEVVLEGYRSRGGRDTDLPGSATVSDLTGGGRADIRLAVDHAGELYLLSKSDGMIRAVVGVATPVTLPQIARQPEPQVLAPGASAVFAIEATNATAYQWKHNGATIAGATGALLVVDNVTVATAGNYTVDVANARGTVTSNAARLTVTPTVDPGRLVNLSVRSLAGTGSQTLIVGFAGSASAAQPLLLRGVGPSLVSFGITNPLADPRIDLLRPRRGGSPAADRIAENDNWETGGSSVAIVGAQVQAFPLAAGSRDAALVVSMLESDSYTLQVTSAVAAGPDTAGIALAEVFAASTPGAAAVGLANVSARAPVSPGENVLITGFTIGGSTARSVLIRAAGPVLGSFGVTGTLADPKLTLFRGTTILGESDNWQTSAELVRAFGETGAFPFVARSRDAVLLLTLPPGSYTAHVSGVGANASGVALIEVYALP